MRIPLMKRFLKPNLWILLFGFVWTNILNLNIVIKNINKYKFYQVVHPANPSSFIELKEKNKFYKQSIFSYIRPVDGVTRLKLYNCSNITSLENIVHRSSQVVVEITNWCMIILAGDNFHAGVSTYERRNGSYPSNLRIFSYIVKNCFLSDNEDITAIQGSMLCSNCCQICLYMWKEIIFYPDHVIKYAMSPSRIGTLEEGTVLMRNLEKIGWVVLKSGYNIKPYS